MPLLLHDTDATYSAPSPAAATLESHSRSAAPSASPSSLPAALGISLSQPQPLLADGGRPSGGSASLDLRRSLPGAHTSRWMRSRTCVDGRLLRHGGFYGSGIGEVGLVLEPHGGR